MTRHAIYETRTAKVFTAEESWEMSEPDMILSLIQQVGVWRLSNSDGCMCGGFTLRNVKVDIACGKGRKRAIWVSSNSMDYTKNDETLRPIADEVARQVEDGDGRGKMAIHLREWSRELD